MSSTIFLAGSMVCTPPAAWPARLFMASKTASLVAASSGDSFIACSRGVTPLSQSSWMRAGVFSQLLTQSFGMSRMGLPDTTSVRMVSRLEALSTLSLCAFGAADSSAQMNRVPTHTPAAPSDSEAASPRPSKMPPAATGTTGTPKWPTLPLQTSTTCGMSAMVPTSPVCPPPSLPCAIRMSAPAARAFCAFLTEPTMFATTTPPAWSFSTAHGGGTPMAQMNSLAFSCTMMSISSGRCPCV
mmetsp:Transcript_32306/g.84777  ORF Transcript_32306/g.84777 Transcript_32306/m.84777 type:complete len:242 (-) Transcript_32306:338-1063(-)